MNPIRTSLAALATAAGLLVALPVVVAALPFWAAAFVVRGARRLATRLERPTVSWHEIVEFEPLIGWKNRPNLDAHGRGSHVFHFTTDGQGWRGRGGLDDSQVVVFGDSFGFGHASDDRTFFGELDSGVRIKAVAADGYSLVQELLWMERLAPRLEDRLVAWFVFYGNDLYDNLQPCHERYRMPFVRHRGGRWEIVTSHVSREPWPFPFRQNYATKLAEICTPSHLSRRAFAACAYLIERGRDVCEEVGARLVVVGIPDKWLLLPEGRRKLASRLPDPEAFDPDRPDRELARICADLGVGFSSLREHLDRSHYLEADSHWNARGHRQVARVLAELYRTPGEARRGGVRPEEVRTAVLSGGRGSGRPPRPAPIPAGEPT